MRIRIYERKYMEDIPAAVALNEAVELVKTFDDPKMRAMLSQENQGTASTPPTFLWTTFEDACVPCENTMLFASALRKCGIPFELHLFEKGPHGGSTGDKASCVQNHRFGAWLDLACDWCADTRSQGK